MTESEARPLCVACGTALEDPQRYNWEGEPWCPACIRRFRVEAEEPASSGEPAEPPLAWEEGDRGPSLRALAEAWGAVCLHPFTFYRRMRHASPWSRPLLFVVAVAALVAPLSLPGAHMAAGWFLPSISTFRHQVQLIEQDLEPDDPAHPAPPPPEVRMEWEPDGGVMLGYQWLLIVLHAVAGGLLLHACALMLAEAHPPGITLRIQFYAAGAGVVLIAPGLAGAMMWPLYQIVLAGIGLHVCHGIRIAKALAISTLATLLFYVLLSMVLAYLLGVGGGLASMAA